MVRFIDSQGRIFRWNYSDLLEIYYPGDQESALTVEGLQETLNRYFKENPDRPAFGGEKNVKEILLKLNSYVQ